MINRISTGIFDAPLATREELDRLKACTEASIEQLRDGVSNIRPDLQDKATTEETNELIDEYSEEWYNALYAKLGHFEDEEEG